MKKSFVKIKIIGLISFCMFMIFPVSGAGKTPDEIFNWVADVMEVKEVHPMPSITFLDKAELQSTFKKLNKKSKTKWEETYGEHKANQILQMYLKELVGLFEPKTKNVYIGSFLESCRQEAILAHELTHYFQIVLDRQYADYISVQEQGLHFQRELEAYAMEKRYRRFFCKNLKEDS